MTMIRPNSRMRSPGIVRRAAPVRGQRRVAGPSGQAIRSRAALARHLRERGDDPGDEMPNWHAYDVPGSKRPVYLPSPTSDEWDEVVDSLARARQSAESGGPMVRDFRQEICCTGEVHLVLTDHDGDYSISVVGAFSDPARGLEAAARASEAFVMAPSGQVVTLWSGEEDDFEVYFIGDDEDNEDVGELDDPSARSWQRLVGLSIAVESGVLLAGPNASTVLPSSEDWLVVPSDDVVHEAILGLDPDAIRVTLRRDNDPGRVEKGTASDSIGSGVANRLAAGWGHPHWYHLTHDAIHEVDVAAQEAISRALRGR
jgi:hypothetical protein